VERVFRVFLRNTSSGDDLLREGSRVFVDVQHAKGLDRIQSRGSLFDVAPAVWTRPRNARERSDKDVDRL
jgi:hypothetical protein